MQGRTPLAHGRHDHFSFFDPKDFLSHFSVLMLPEVRDRRLFRRTSEINQPAYSNLQLFDNGSRSFFCVH
jgi:hypothetical protein